MSNHIAQTFDQNLAREYKIFDRTDTIKAFAKCAHKGAFRDNLDAWCRRRAFDATVAAVAKEMKTRDVDRIAAALRRAGIIYVASQKTVINKHSVH